MEFLRFALPILKDLNKKINASRKTEVVLFISLDLHSVHKFYSTFYTHLVYEELIEEEKNKAKDISGAKEVKILSNDGIHVRIHMPLLELCKSGLIQISLNF